MQAIEQKPFHTWRVQIIFDTYPHAPIEALFIGLFIGWAILEGTTMLRKWVFGGDVIDATLVTIPS